MKTLTIIVCVLFCFFAAWTYLRYWSEDGLSIHIPKCANSIVSKISGMEIDPRADADFSIFIHRSQIHPWGTLWLGQFISTKQPGGWNHGLYSNEPKQ